MNEQKVTKEQFMQSLIQTLNQFNPAITLLTNAYIQLCNKYGLPHHEELMKQAGYENITGADGSEEWVLKQQPQDEKPAKTRKPRTRK